MERGFCPRIDLQTRTGTSFAVIAALSQHSARSPPAPCRQSVALATSPRAARRDTSALGRGRRPARGNRVNLNRKCDCPNSLVVPPRVGLYRFASQNLDCFAVVVFQAVNHRLLSVVI